MSAIASVARLTATLAVFSLHNRRARSSAWLAPNSSPISQTARPFAESLVSSSRHIIVGRVSVKSLLPARPTSHANVIAQGLRSPVQNIVLTRTGSTSGSGSPEPRSDSSMPYEHAYYCAPRNKSRLKQSLSSRCTAGFRAAYGRYGSFASDMIVRIQRGMSASPRKRTNGPTFWDVRFVPLAAVSRCSNIRPSCRALCNGIVSRPDLAMLIFCNTPDESRLNHHSAQIVAMLHYY
jgi:hypothetical protein